MASALNISAINGILPKLISEGKNLVVAQSRFFKQMKKVKETMKINPTGEFLPYTTLENDTAFGVAENGPILGGGAPEYELGNANLRAHWSSIVWSGKLERIQTQYLTQLRRDPAYEGQSESRLLRVAQNFAVRDQVLSALKTYASRDNYFALQGTEKSALGVITGLTSPATLQFSWDSTNQGNRRFNKDQQIQIFAPDGTQRVTGLSTSNSSRFNTVASVDKTPASGGTGPVVLAENYPSNAAIGDTVVFRNSYSLMPQGFIDRVDDTGSFNGILRSTNPAIFNSVITRLSGAPTVGPSHFREQLSQMQTKVGYGVEMMYDLWVNKTQYYNFEGQIYSSPFTRFIGPGQVKGLDPSVGKLSWDGHDLNMDSDVPPAHVNFINFATWHRIVQTPLQPYAYDSGSYVVSTMNSFGERLDQRQSTMFSEYNWVCDDARANGRIEGLGFNKIHI